MCFHYKTHCRLMIGKRKRKKRSRRNSCSCVLIGSLISRSFFSMGYKNHAYKKFSEKRLFCIVFNMEKKALVAGPFARLSHASYNQHQLLQVLRKKFRHLLLWIKRVVKVNRAELHTVFNLGVLSPAPSSAFTWDKNSEGFFKNEHLYFCKKSYSIVS